ncbi:neuropeptide precursor 4F [Danaus plexippus plexippus]|uniref:Neuropeptide 4F n=1 Tax=Danaus plexippus plexippus TaxID=278856 RepID=A0A212FBI5_DANPL|nr:neuropeptide precursor 4F [Danaus plexippus plexippus]
MFRKLFALFAVVAVAFAAPKPEPAPQLVAYSAGLDYVYPAAYSASLPSVVSPYNAPLAPLTYSAYPANAYFVR